MCNSQQHLSGPRSRADSTPSPEDTALHWLQGPGEPPPPAGFPTCGRGTGLAGLVTMSPGPKAALRSQPQISDAHRSQAGPGDRGDFPQPDGERRCRCAVSPPASRGVPRSLRASAGTAGCSEEGAPEPCRLSSGTEKRRGRPGACEARWLVALRPSKSRRPAHSSGPACPSLQPPLLPILTRGTQARGGHELPRPRPGAAPWVPGPGLPRSAWRLVGPAWAPRSS